MILEIILVLTILLIWFLITRDKDPCAWARESRERKESDK